MCKIQAILTFTGESVIGYNLCKAYFGNSYENENMHNLWLNDLISKNTFL